MLRFLYLQHLNKCKSALQDVHESRLKFYDHIEEGIHELENENEALKEEAVVNKQKIRE